MGDLQEKSLRRGAMPRKMWRCAHCFRSATWRSPLPGTPSVAASKNVT